MSSFESLTQSVAAQANLEQALEALLDGLAQRVKATSNDQNIQRWARELRIAAPDLVKTVAGKQHAPAS